MKSVTLKFAGLKSTDTARRFYTYLVDGGLEDHLIDVLSDGDIDLEISECDGERLKVTFQCSPRKVRDHSEK